MSIQKFAASVGVSKMAISDYLNGKMRVSMKLAQKIAEITNQECTVEELMILNAPKKGQQPSKEFIDFQRKNLSKKLNKLYKQAKNSWI